MKHETFALERPPQNRFHRDSGVRLLGIHTVGTSGRDRRMIQQLLPSDVGFRVGVLDVHTRVSISGGRAMLIRKMLLLVGIFDDSAHSELKIIRGNVGTRNTTADVPNVCASFTRPVPLSVVNGVLVGVMLGGDNF